MPNPIPEKRVGLALLFIGVISLYIFMLSVWAGNSASPWAFAAIVLVLWAGWRLRERFKSLGAPPPPPKPSGPARGAGKASGKAAPRKGGFGLPFGRKPAPPPPPPPPPAPPPKRGPLGFLRPRAKGPPKK
nr:hypothetical protein [Chloroflexota bacterium]